MFCLQFECVVGGIFQIDNICPNIDNFNYIQIGGQLTFNMHVAVIRT